MKRKGNIYICVCIYTGLVIQEQAVGEILNEGEREGKWKKKNKKPRPFPVRKLEIFFFLFFFFVRIITFLV